MNPNADDPSLRGDVEVNVDDPSWRCYVDVGVRKQFQERVRDQPSINGRA